MEFTGYADSYSYFHPAEGVQANPRMSRFMSIQGRIACLGLLIEKLFVLPFALLFKAYKTFFRSIGVLLGAVFLLVTLGISQSAREWFMRRVAYLSKDVADWILLPLAIVTCFVRLVLAFAIHPALYFGF